MAHRWHLRHDGGALRRLSRLAGPTRSNQAGCRERRERLCGVCLTWMGSAAVLEGARAGEASAGEASGRWCAHPVEPSRPRPSPSLREYVWLACFHCTPAPAAPPRLPTLLFAQQHLKLFRPSKFGSEWGPRV